MWNFNPQNGEDLMQNCIGFFVFLLAIGIYGVGIFTGWLIWAQGV